MSEGEFDLIRRYFSTAGKASRAEVILSIGDDCALTKLQPHQTLAITTDTMVENSHFYPDIAPYDLAYKAVATNLSDLAAMGAEPAWISLALTLPRVDSSWLSEFSRGLFDILDRYNVALIGGDTTQGKLTTVTITAQGILNQDYALRRDQAQVGDFIYVSGTLGDGLAGFHLLRAMQQGEKRALDSDRDFLIRRNFHPQPRVELGLCLARHRLANAAIDLSDGLGGDLGHILARSRVSAEIDLDQLPLSEPLLRLYGREQAELLGIQGGEDYELCFTVSPSRQAELDRHLAQLQVPYRRIGRILPAHSSPEITFIRGGKRLDIEVTGFEHFK
ncbi:thiamine-phosphate kinase [Mesocricetibacter intestinalis]|uniref:Thiamine-monophosphate kinase n=1 Tax=Mesocricetibacter intestinalis TaxID=1521930 RepID=A0A4R6V7G4_9PAST|nr:thiamine-phosphate kinase [Mesocricetibacter intestinalis]TDQ57417.1 thiamine-phosphate kinase [Mesocricetibacter intestinalis]